jgi:hypothetical protein
MVYCVKCGVKNSDDSAFCVKCGENLTSSQEKKWDERIEAWGEDFGKRAEKWGEQFGKQMENECFWLPRVGAIFGLIIGVIIILAGLRLLFGWNIEVFIRSLGSIATIIIGSLFIIFAILLFSRRKR